MSDGVQGCYSRLLQMDGCWQQETLRRVHQGICQKQPSWLKAGADRARLRHMRQEGVTVWV